MSMLTPVIENAKDEHEHLYYHHIYEEEEHRLSRLKELLPLIEKFQRGEYPISPQHREFNQLLQELNLEKFGLHNFVEHLDLAMFSFKDEERHSILSKMREDSYSDYQKVKQILIEINNKFNHVYEDPHEHHDHDGDHLALTESAQQLSSTPAQANPYKLTVGSLIIK